MVKAGTLDRSDAAKLFCTNGSDFFEALLAIDFADGNINVGKE